MLARLAIKSLHALTAVAATLSACTTTGNLSTKDLGSIANCTYVLIGASSGFGQGVALKLAAQRANVVLAARRADLLEEVAAEARATGGHAVVVPMDISNPDDVQRVSETAIGQYGRIDTWINFAGTGAIGPFWDVPVADHARVLDVNLKGIVYVYKSALDLSDMSDAMNDQTADRWSLGMWPTSSPASLTPRFAASGLDLAHTPESRALMPSTASLVRRLCLSFGLG